MEKAKKMAEYIANHEQSSDSIEAMVEDMTKGMVSISDKPKTPPKLIFEEKVIFPSLIFLGKHGTFLSQFLHQL